jgi:hypothetical protein
VSIIGLVNIELPAHCYKFFEVCFDFAQMDVFHAEQIYENTFDFEPTTPLNDRFDQFGTSTKNFVMNSGSYFIM